MAINFKRLELNVLLLHKGAYDKIDLNGRKYIKGWNIKELERAVYCSSCMSFNIPDIKILYNDLEELDIIQPFLKFGEEGQHYGYELFLSEIQNVSRGDDLFRVYMSRKFTYDKLPLNQEKLIDKYTELCEELGIIRNGVLHFQIRDVKNINKYFDSGYAMHNGLSEKYVNLLFEKIVMRNKKYRK